MSTEKNVILMDEDRVHRSLKRMVHEIAESNISNRPILLIGINQRGYAVAVALADLLKSIFAEPIQAIQLHLEERKQNDLNEQVQDDISKNPFIIAVDDVIFSGSTMFKTLKYISEQLNPGEIHTAVMIDRGHRKFPVKVKFCGMELPTKLNEHVSVLVNNNKIQQIVLSDKDK